MPVNLGLFRRPRSPCISYYFYYLRSLHLLLVHHIARVQIRRFEIAPCPVDAPCTEYSIIRIRNAKLEHYHRFPRLFSYVYRYRYYTILITSLDPQLPEIKIQELHFESPFLQNLHRARARARKPMWSFESHTRHAHTYSRPTHACRLQVGATTLHF